MQLKGKNAVVTGGNRGIGKAISLALAQKGVNVAISFVENEDKAKETIEELEKTGVKSLKLQVDVANFEEVKNMVHVVNKNLGGTDILVNNAGISGWNSNLGSIDSQEWQKVIEVNLTGVFNCCKAFEKQLRRNKGKIVNISSIAGKMGGTMGCHYAASKAGVIGLTFALAKELAPQVTVNAIAPGPVDTDLLTSEKKKELSALTPFGRIARPEEIAHTVIYLLENDYVTGEVIDINAGRYMD